MVDGMGCHTEVCHISSIMYQITTAWQFYDGSRWGIRRMAVPWVCLPYGLENKGGRLGSGKITGAQHPILIRHHITDDVMTSPCKMCSFIITDEKGIFTKVTPMT